MCLRRLRKFVEKYDAAIKACQPDLGAAFQCYPRGSCGVASEVLAQFLVQENYGVFSRISGSSASVSHEWLEKGDIVVDVTAGQFADAPESIIVSRDLSWHQKFGNREEFVDGSFLAFANGSPDSEIAFIKISKEFDRTK